MAYRYGEREQIAFLPRSIEEYVAPAAPVRAYDAMVEAMDFDELGIEGDEHQAGNPQYEPKAMLKLLVYGYSYGVRSSRKLERETYNNLSFIWLMGGLTPDHKTIAEFRRRNKGALKKVLKECARICIKLNLIAGNSLFVDGSKIRANASIKGFWDKDRCEEKIKEIDRRIEEILKECDRVDEEEKEEDSYVRMEKELEDKKALRAKVEEIMEELKEGSKRELNRTDGDCIKANSIHGTHAGYNSQVVVDGKEGLIVQSDVVAKNNDNEQFAGQILSANEVVDGKCETACADSGYFKPEGLKEVEEKGVKVVVPSYAQAEGKKPGPFDHDSFEYDEKDNCYRCPEGQILTHRGTNKDGDRAYRISNPNICRKCRHYGKCTEDKNGRKVLRMHNYELRKEFEAKFEQSDSQEIYKLRKCKVELPFGHIKRNLKMDAFLLRGLDGVKAEMSILGTCFNIVRMITIFGVGGLMTKLAS